ncbi:MAG: class II aldolase/adducin family protein, partial [Candidatus Omnitrophica bacterium]|nr:class II aldolase/adducin family protein [Candidatus Omnitrophota bacterium]
MSEKILELKKSIISIGRLLWEKDLVSGLNGNISARVDEGSLLLTAHGTCLGLLQDKDILHVDLDGNVIGEGSVSTEKLLHTEIYKNFSDTEAVIHTHTTYTNAYFLDHEVLSPRIFESKIYLGDVKGIPQKTPAVTDVKPVIETLKNNAIVVLRNHGVVAM